MSQGPTTFYQASPPARVAGCYYGSPAGLSSTNGALPLRILNASPARGYEAPSAALSLSPEFQCIYSPTAPSYRWQGYGSPQAPTSHLYSPGPEFIGTPLKKQLASLEASGRPWEQFEYLTHTPTYLEHCWIHTQYGPRLISPPGLRLATSQVFPDSPSYIIESPVEPPRIVVGVNTSGVTYFRGVVRKDGKFDKEASEAVKVRQQVHQVDEKLIKIGEEGRRFRRALKALVNGAKRTKALKALRGFLNRFKTGVENPREEKNKAVEDLEQQERAAYNRRRQGQYTPPLTRGAERHRVQRAEEERQRAHVELLHEIFGSDEE